MKTLVEINVACNWGSTGRIAEQIGLKAMQHGWDAHIAHSSRYVNSSQLKTYQLQDKWADYKHFIWDSTILGRSGLGSVTSTKRFLKYLDEIKPTIVHLHNIHGHYINYELLLGYLAEKDIPVVWTMHDCWPITGHCAYFDSIDCLKWKTECGNFQLQKDFPKSLFFDTSTSAFRLKKRLLNAIPNLTLVPVSGWLGDIARESMVGNHAKVHVIHNGIDLNVFKATNPKCNDGRFRILGVAAGYDERKGLNDFNQLRGILGDEYEITMVGLYGDEIHKIVPGIKGIERTDSLEELVRLYNEADVYINPTYSDNFPTTNIEALACGTPIITYKTGGSPEAIKGNGVGVMVDSGIESYPTGMVVEQGNVQALADAIKQMKEHPIASEVCRKRAKDLFDKDKCFEEYITLYEEILRTRS